MIVRKFTLDSYHFSGQTRQLTFAFSHGRHYFDSENYQKNVFLIEKGLLLYN